MSHHTPEDPQCEKQHAFFKSKDLEQEYHLSDESPIVLYCRYQFVTIFTYNRVLKKNSAKSYQTSIYALTRSLCRYAALTLKDKDCEDWAAYEDGKVIDIPLSLVAFSGISTS